MVPNCYMASPVSCDRLISAFTRAAIGVSSAASELNWIVTNAVDSYRGIFSSSAKKYPSAIVSPPIGYAGASCAASFTFSIPCASQYSPSVFWDGGTHIGAGMSPPALARIGSSLGRRAANHG